MAIRNALFFEYFYHKKNAAEGQKPNPCIGSSFHHDVSGKKYLLLLDLFYSLWIQVIS